MKTEAGFRFRHDAGQLPERLRHQPRLETHLRVAHLAIDFRLGHERGHRVDDDDIDAARSDENFDDLERLLAVVGLRHEQVFEINAEFLCIRGVERMFRVDERRHPAKLLRLGDDLQGERGLARRLGPEDLDHASARHAADAERVIDADGAGRNGFDWLNGALLAEAHDGALRRTAFRFARPPTRRLSYVRGPDGRPCAQQSPCGGSFVFATDCQCPSAELYSRNVPSESQAQKRAWPSIRVFITVTYGFRHFRPSSGSWQNLP